MAFAVNDGPSGRAFSDAARILGLALVLGVVSACSAPKVPDCEAEGGAPLPTTLCDGSDDAGQNRVDTALTLGEGESYDIPTLVRAVIEGNPDINIAAVSEREQAIAVDLAKASRRPQAELTAGAGPQYIADLEDPDMTRREASLTVRQTIYDFGITRNDIKRAEKTAETARFARLAQTERTVFDVMSAYVDYREGAETIALLEGYVQDVTDLLALVVEREATGLSDQSDVNSLNARLEAARSDLIDAVNAREVAAGDFKILSGLAPDGLVLGASSLFDGQLDATSEVRFLDHPDVSAIRAEIKALRYQLAAKSAERFPVLALQGTARGNRNVSSASSDDTFAGLTAMATMRLNLYSGGQRKKQEEVLRLRIRDAELRLEKQLRILEREALDLTRVAGTQADKSDMLRAKVEAAAKVLELNSEKFKESEISAFVLLDGQKQYLDARLDLIRQGYDVTRTELRRLFLNSDLVATLMATAP